MSHLGTPSRRETSHSRATSEQAVQRASDSTCANAVLLVSFGGTRPTVADAAP